MQIGGKSEESHLGTLGIAVHGVGAAHEVLDLGFETFVRPLRYSEAGGVALLTGQIRFDGVHD